MSNEIMWQDLPQTLKDAISVTQELHIRFLWIDSLCIVQDDAEETPTEIAHMPEIYSCAAVTILASRASNVQEGFLQNRQITRYPDLVFELPYRCLTGELGSVIAPFSPESIKWTQPIDNVSSGHRVFPSCIDSKTVLRELNSERGQFKSVCCRQ
jgi:Heterokaryon incompatibility protein (HET)